MDETKDVDGLSQDRAEKKDYEYDVFISYRRETGIHLARTIKYWFESKGIKAFLDVVDLKSGEWSKDLETAILHSKYFFLLMTQDALTENVCQEILWAKKTHDTKQIIPVAVDFKYTEPDILKGQQGFRLDSSPDNFLGSLLLVVQKCMGEFNSRLASKERNSDQLLSSIRWYKRNDGKIDRDEKKLLQEQAKRLKVSDTTLDLLMSQVEAEWADECTFSNDYIRPYFKNGNRSIDNDELEKLQGLARSFKISQDRLNELILAVREKETARKHRILQIVATILLLVITGVVGWRYRAREEENQAKLAAERAKMTAEVAQIKDSAERAKVDAEKRAAIASSMRETSEKNAQLSKDRLQRELDAANAALATATDARESAEKKLAAANASFEAERAAFAQERQAIKKQNAVDLKKMEDRASAAEGTAADKAAELLREREKVRKLEEEKAALQKKLDAAQLEDLRNI